MKGRQDGGAGDDGLLRAVAEGDHRAFRTLMERHVPILLGFAARVLGSPHDAEEVVQEVFVKVWTGAGKWQADGGARFSTWVYRVTLNACIDRRRLKRPEPLDQADELADSAPGSLDQAMARQRQDIVLAALQDLTEAQRAALSLHYFSQLSAPEAARILNLSVTAMEASLIRGKRALKAALKRRGIENLGDIQ